MKSEPLKGKIMYENLIYTDNSNFGDRDTVIRQWQDFAKDIKSALEWMIQQHEKKIEYLIKEMREQDSISFFKSEHYIIMLQLEREYESIMILEEGLSDVV